jgi:hypothetical protein
MKLEHYLAIQDYGVRFVNGLIIVVTTDSMHILFKIVAKPGDPKKNEYWHFVEAS